MKENLHRDSKPLPSHGTNQLINTPCWKLIERAISNISLEKDFTVAQVGSGYTSIDKLNIVKSEVDKKLRESKVCFLDGIDYPELYEQLFAIVDYYNKDVSKWGYDVCGMDDMQYGIYSEGGFYDWHIDEYPSPIWISSPNSFNKKLGSWYNRKISVSIFLNDPSEYEGGELDIEVDGPKADSRYETFKLPKGSIVVFPSNKWHRVRPITSGVRKSLVAWIFGPPFR